MLELVNLENPKMFIGGKWETAKEGATTGIYSPSTKEAVSQIPRGGREEAEKAFHFAGKAFEEWSQMTAVARAGFLLRIKDLLLENQEEVAKIMSLEMGKVYNESLAEVNFSAQFFEWYAEEGKRVYGETIPASDSEKRLTVIKQPVGVTFAITPWNFPLSMMARKVSASLAAGCTMVVKPATQGSLTALAFAKLVEKAGVPAGVVNVVTGSAQAISEEAFNNELVKKVSFTGSTEVGRSLVKQSANQLKKLSLELGGHAPFIVFDDADLDKAADGVIASKFRNSGQTCVCANRVYVHANIKDEFEEILVSKVKNLVVGNSLERASQIGPLVSEDGLEKTKYHVEDATGKGAKVLYGGTSPVNLDGYFYEPTILSEVTGDMIIMEEETFGPVMPLITFEEDEDVIKQANNTEYGLAAYFYTQNLARSIRVSESLNFGIIGVNDGMPAVPQAPFGGINHSGYGKEGGHQGIKEYLNEKYISLSIE